MSRVTQSGCQIQELSRASIFKDDQLWVLNVIRFESMQFRKDKTAPREESISTAKSLACVFPSNAVKSCPFRRG